MFPHSDKFLLSVEIYIYILVYVNNICHFYFLETFHCQRGMQCRVGRRDSSRLSTTANSSNRLCYTRARASSYSTYHGRTEKIFNSITRAMQQRRIDSPD